MKFGEQIYVAYADDHVAVRESIATVISKDAVTVFIQADNGLELIQKIEKAERLPDICMLDIHMPVMNGFETQVELMKRWPDMKTLVLTIHDSEKYIIKMIANNANGYLLKSCSPREIEKALISIYENGIYHSEIANGQIFHAARRNEAKLPHFTENEIQVLKYCCADLTYEEMSVKMGMSKRSVEAYRDSLFKKLGLNTKVALVLYAVQSGIVPFEIHPDI